MPDHDHGHAHAPAELRRGLRDRHRAQLTFVIVEAVYGIIGHSVALLADAGHNLGDVLGLAASPGSPSVLVKRAPTARYTYGLRGSSILAALFNAVFLLMTVGAISWEAILRLGTPGAGRRRDGDDRRRHRHRRQRRHRLAVRLRPQGRPQPARRLPAHGGRRADLGRRGGRRPRDLADGLAMARPGRQPRDQRGHRLGNLGPAARFALGMSMAAVPPHIDPAEVRAFSDRRGRRRQPCTTCTSGR